ncbi:MAG TPA: dTDP-4-dehydrorhamnose reductase, partial [Hyphomicrobiales bacterium]|nr:dTDP-4-dehydrorhamnose reductase [Hyphomicrobiales bacterium]
PIIHISTDYVFDGEKPSPYVETDPTAPQGVYGRSKYEGELAVADANPHHVILRTAWVYSEYGSNFVKTMLRLARKKPELRVVADQNGNPTHAGDLAEAIVKIAGKLVSGTDTESLWGVYHLAGEGETTWHGLAKHIIDCAARLGMPPIPVIPITTAEFPTPAKRPANSRLDCSKATATFDVTLPRWQDSVERCVRTLIDNQEQSKTGELS